MQRLNTATVHHPFHYSQAPVLIYSYVFVFIAMCIVKAIEFCFIVLKQMLDPAVLHPSKTRLQHPCLVCASLSRSQSAH